MGEQRSLFRHPDFMKLWVGQSISSFGSQFSPFAIQVTAVYILGATSFQLGVLSFLNTIPFLTMGLLVGVYVDRHRRRRIMIFADLGRALVIFLIPLSAVVYVVTMNLLYLVTLVAGVLTVFFEITYQSYLPSLVDRSQIVDANSKLQATASTASTLGPSIAGGITYLVTAPMACLGDTFGYICSVVSLSLIKKPEPIDTSRAHASVLKDIREGLHVVLRDPRLRSIAACTATANLASSAWGAILYKYFDNLGMVPWQIGLVFTVGGTGAILGALTAMRVTKRLGVGGILVVGMALSGATISLYFATPDTVFYLVPVSYFVMNLGVLWYNIPQVSYRQSLVPAEIQGRMNATMRTIVWGTIPLGGLLGGIMGEVLGVHDTIGLMTALGALAFLFVLLSPMRQIKEFPTSSETVG
ncbi:MAG: MFS transporter [Nitrososphaerales archaeon]